jgi:hypothetical protein
VNTVAEKPSEAVPHPSTLLAAQIRALPPNEAAALIERTVPAEAVEALMQLNPAIVQDILAQLPRKSPSNGSATSNTPKAPSGGSWKRRSRYSAPT